MDEKEIAGYLRSHPEFFEHYADLLAQVVIPDPHGGHAISITERQIGILRQRNKQLEAKLAELVQFGEDNDAIGEKLHRLAVALSGSGDFPAVRRTLQSHLGEDFAVPHVLLRLWQGASGDEGLELLPPEAAAVDFVAGLKTPYCGPASLLPGFSWLPPGIRSLALMPMRHRHELIGVLILASEDEQRFHPAMGTLYLGRLGELTAAALARTLAL